MHDHYSMTCAEAMDGRKMSLTGAKEQRQEGENGRKELTISDCPNCVCKGIVPSQNMQLILRQHGSAERGPIVGENVVYVTKCIRFV